MKQNNITDDDLIKGCRKNDRRCQEMLYRRYAKALFCLCLIYENNRDNAKDLLQDSFIKIFSNISSFNGKGSLKCWMRKIITNTAIDHFRHHYRELHYVSIEKTDQPVSDEESVASIMNTKDIVSQVKRLPAGARMIFQLYAIEGYTHKEIANLLHISEGTSKSQINRAKHLLQSWISGLNLNTES